MLSNNQVKHISALKLKKFRDEYREFVAEGNTLVCDLIRSSFAIAGVYALSEWITGNHDIIMQYRVPVFEAELRDMERITSLNSPSPVLAVVKIPAPVTAGSYDADPSSPPISQLRGCLTLMLDRISDPGNFGTLLRIADWFGIATVVCSPDCVELYNPKVVQSSMGSIARVNVIYTDLPEMLERLSGAIPVYGTFLEGEPVHSFGNVSEGIVVIGSEAHGISARLGSMVSQKVFIPSHSPAGRSKAESLNAAVAAGIVIACLRRP